MFSYLFYKWLHLSSLLVMTLSTGVLLSAAFGNSLEAPLRKKLTALHGSSVFLVLFAGFGLLAKAKIDGAFGQGWFLTKLGVWLLFGMLPLFLKRFPQSVQRKLILIYSVLVMFTVYMVLNRPF